jgi:hypothetical protein
MSRQVVVVLYVVAMVAIIVALDFVFFRNSFLGTAYGEHWHCLGVRSLLLQVPQAFLIAN